MKAVWILPGLFTIFAIIVNFGGFCDLVASFFQMCFWPGLIAVGIVVAVVAMGKR